MARKTKAAKAEPQVDVGAEIFASLRELEKIKGIPVDYMVERLKQALANAYRKDREDHRDVPADNVIVNLDEHGLSIHLVKTAVTEDELEELKKTQELFAQAIREGDAMRIAQTDERYHEIIYGSTKNEKLVQILNNLREQMYRYRLEYIKDEDKRHILLVEHDQILKALSLRHVHEAKIAIREHIDNQEITILKNLKEQENDVQRKVSGRRNPV